MKPIMDQVKAVDRERKAEDFDMAPYQENKGKSLYIFYIKMFEIMEEEYDTKLAEPTNTLGSDEHHKSMEMKPDVIPPLGIQFMEAEKDETSFDITKSDPFEGVREEWGDWNHEEQRGLLEEIFDLLLGNEDPKDEELLDDGKREYISQKWVELTRFEQKVYLLDFCLSVNQDLKNMNGINDIDLVELYKNSTTKMDDMFKYKRSCVIL